MCKHGQTAMVGTISVDLCLAPLVAALNQAGIDTRASCCGHGHRPASIALRDGREIIIARTYEEARLIDRLFPFDIHGVRRPTTGGGA